MNVDWQEDLRFVNALREFLGKSPLPFEPEAGSLYCLDGKEHLSALQWMRKLGISRQAVFSRLKTIEERLARGDRNPYRQQYTKQMKGKSRDLVL